MASLPTPTGPAAGADTKTYSSSFTTTSPAVSSWPLLSKKITLNKSLKHKISCNAGSSDNSSLNNLDRRNVLLGLGGLAGAVNLTSVPSVGAAPISAPDISKCGVNTLTGFRLGGSTPTGGDCCPPNSTQILDYQFPVDQPLRIRSPTHILTRSRRDKFNEAIKRRGVSPLRKRPRFKTSLGAFRRSLLMYLLFKKKKKAHIHRAYCNGAYTQSSSGFPDIEIQIHNSWLFFPFHRWYLYFYERILGSLIDDPTFSLPYWAWDTPNGMLIPKYLNDPLYAFYDPKRNQAHLNGYVDLGYNGKDSGITEIEIMKNNLAIMYRQMVTNATDPTAFFGGEYRAGSEPIRGGGSIEQSPHTPVHRWVGDPREANGENLGNFYSAGRDTLFYCHHANVDRMWSLWKGMGGKHKDITDPDWLNTSFVFYDENKNLVRVYVKDCLSTTQLGYDYQKLGTPWLNSKPVPRAPKSGIARRSIGKVKQAKEVKFPVKLDKTVKVLVPRPKKSRSKKEKEEQEELLIVQGITYDSEKYVKFDVYVNDEDDDDNTAPDQTEFAGSFAQLPHKHKGKTMSKTNFRAGLTELLEDLQADDDDNVLVTVVPRSGSEDITIDAIKIILA